MWTNSYRAGRTLRVPIVGDAGGWMHTVLAFRLHVLDVGDAFGARRSFKAQCGYRRMQTAVEGVA